MTKALAHDEVAPGPVERVGLPPLMALTAGRSDLVIGLLDGPVSLDHPGLDARNIRVVPGFDAPTDASANHGTFVAGILSGRRDGTAPAIAPACVLLVRPVFTGELPSTSPANLATALIDCVDAGARIVNLSAAESGTSVGEGTELADALDYAVRNGVLIVAAAGNRSVLGGSALVSHPWVIPVATPAGDDRSTLGRSIGRGLAVPDNEVFSLSPDGGTTVMAGTSVAAPFVTGAAALLWSLFPAATAAEVRFALLSPGGATRRRVVPPLLDAWGAYPILREMVNERSVRP
ncbi:S8 family serine peptidase [Amycolatopsis sp.]|uniref:S8 family serine peptidase n=1 Tax=Amycolatopsis sp. TaxID=37632 RepID=UPI002BB200A7|nr:S8 family serine peptidase [Amycolatopsis sp.]HVV12448.1 S8 family serine peptidase [Amycolatopsis sp.]